MAGSEEKALVGEQIKSKTGMILRAILSEIPGGASVISIITDQVTSDLNRRISRIENAFADVVGSSLPSGQSLRQVLDGFQFLRLQKFLVRALDVDEAEWWDVLAHAWASFLGTDEPPELRAEIDRVMLGIDPHDVKLLKNCQSHFKKGKGATN